MRGWAPVSDDCSVSLPGGGPVTLRGLGSSNGIVSSFRRGPRPAASLVASKLEEGKSQMRRTLMARLDVALLILLVVLFQAPLARTAAGAPQSRLPDKKVSLNVEDMDV